ncbi:hypothetical protein R0G64_31940, partial [Pseudomonas otitidis]|nr:hypothetical protein [Pseudomonas otitidis]
KDRQGAVFGGLWIARDTPWSEAEQALLVQLGGTYDHARLAQQAGGQALGCRPFDEGNEGGVGLHHADAGEG